MNQYYFLGTLYLLILTYQDIKNKMLVDDRYNYFMLGATIMLYSYYQHTFTYILSLIIIIALLSWFVNKFKLLGSADIKTLSWCFLGLGIIERNMLVFFLLSFMIIQMIYAIINGIWFKQPKVPGYPLFLISFILTWVVF